MNKKEYQDISIKILNLFKEMDEINNNFSKKYDISCVSTCNGQCCLKKDVEVNPVELLPLVIDLYEKNEIFQFYNEAKNKENEHCLFFKNGKCSIYEKRTVLCRLFAFASIYNRKKEKTLSICSQIKENKTFNFTQSEIDESANIVDFSSKIATLLPNWNNNPMSLNKAFIYATEQYLSSVQYE